MRDGEKPTNPKDLVAVTKLPLELVPDSLALYASLAFLEGASKYGRFNWRIAGVSISVYVGACRRHITNFYNGEWADPQSKVPHLASAIACLAIILDAYLLGKLTDDRPPRSPNLILQLDSLQSVVKHLHAIHADKHPKQFTIADGIQPIESQ